MSDFTSNKSSTCARKMLRTLSLSSITAALLLISGCRSLDPAAQSVQADLQPAITTMVPALQQLSAFGSDHFVLSSHSLSADELSAAAQALRQAGAAVSLQPADTAILDAAPELQLSKGLRLEKAEVDAQTLLSLSLDSVTLQCCFASAGGQLKPISAISVMRRQ